MHSEVVVAEAIFYFDLGTLRLILVELYECQMTGGMIKVLPRDHKKRMKYSLKEDEIFIGGSQINLN